jgi:polyphosphate kinase
MTRNLTRRIELMCPVFEAPLRKIMINVLHLNLSDNVKARELNSSGAYEPVRNSFTPLRSQFEAMDIPSWKGYV